MIYLTVQYWISAKTPYKAAHSPHQYYDQFNIQWNYREIWLFIEHALKIGPCDAAILFMSLFLPSGWNCWYGWYFPCYKERVVVSNTVSMLETIYIHDLRTLYKTETQWLMSTKHCVIPPTHVTRLSYDNKDTLLKNPVRTGYPGCGMSRRPWPRLNIKTVLSTYGDFHVKDKTAVRTSYL